MLPNKDRFCSYCASPLEMKDIEASLRQWCPNCKRILYYDPKVVATVVVEQDEKILFVRRALQPGLGLWALPGGYVDRGEIVEQGAAREVMEETGLFVQIKELIGLFSEEGHPVILAAYSCCLESGEPIPGPEVSELGFYALNDLPVLAFPRDTRVLEAWQAKRHSLKAKNPQD